MTIFILLPAYNEFDNLPTLISSLHMVLKKTGLPYQIVIVDDGSTDKTSTLAKFYKADAAIQVAKHKINWGLGAAMDTGFKATLKKAKDDDLLISMDADNTHDVTAIPSIMKKYEQEYDLILTSRFLPGGGDQGISLLRKILSHQAGHIFQLLFPIAGVREYTSSYRGYRISLLRRAYAHFGDNFINEKGFNCMLEILVKLSTFSPKIIEVPVMLYYDRKKGKSKMDIKKTMWRYMVIAMNRKRFIGQT